MNIKHLLLLAVVIVTTGVIPKTIITRRTQSRAAGHISGKVEIILQTMLFTVEQKKAMLEVEWRNMLTLGLDKTEPALLAKIEAHLGLSKVQAGRLKKLEKQTLQAKEQQAVAKATDVTVMEERQVSDVASYAQTLIANAAPYSDGIDVPGMPSVSQQRELTVIERMRSSSKNSELAEHFARVEAIHKKIIQLARGSKVLKTFTDTFIGHLVQKYQARQNAMDHEIYYRSYEVLADALPDDTRTVAQVVGPFLQKYNKYAAQAYRLGESELAVPYIEWSSLITSSKKAEAHIMLLLSFSMEQVKLGAKRSAVQVQQQELLVEKTNEAVQHLKHAKVTLEESNVTQPMYVAMACGTQVEKLVMDAGGVEKMLPEHREQAELFARLAEQLNQLSADYEIVVQQQAGGAATRRLQNDIAALPVQQQQALFVQPQTDQMAMMIGVDGQPVDARGAPLPFAPKKSGLHPIVPVLIATGIGITWEVLGTVAQNKVQKGEDRGEQVGSFWRMLAPIGTPSGGAKAALDKVKALFGKGDKKDAEPDKPATADAASSTADVSAGSAVPESPATTSDQSSAADKPAGPEQPEGVPTEPDVSAKPEQPDRHPEQPDRHPEQPDRHPELVSGTTDRPAAGEVVPPPPAFNAAAAAAAAVSPQ